MLRQRAGFVAQRCSRLRQHRCFCSWANYAELCHAVKLLSARIFRTFDRPRMAWRAWVAVAKSENSFRLAVKTRAVRNFRNFVIALEAQRVNHKRKANAQKYAVICLLHFSVTRWVLWFRFRRHQRDKFRIRFTSVHNKTRLRILRFAQLHWEFYVSQIVHPVQRRFERLVRRRKTKAIADRMPDLLESRIRKIISTILGGSHIGAVSSSKLRLHILHNAFDTWAKRKPYYNMAGSFLSGT